MTNEINGLPGSRPVETGNAKGAKAPASSAGSSGAGSAPAPGSSAPTDTLNLTDAAARLQRLEALVADLPAVDQQRVEALRREVASGAYKTDPERVADRLVRLERELVRNR
jgi:negative regulator of flagellin synthesis FlgM